ncbi:uncharacterized protein F5891DRAFT_1199929 [Suillus fuscotomentosus]|uniref:Uncharacterized protein n=1 Tax=Suillus fuscotomentosus TaxID=1912939 RepID=A0AAD4DP87_9AGAM|nr:uncharacterized protein F5891DRAFT_1199929 [Suillus fuscotomentosus]KAG1887466.1 hypothetical protein F5891DRAFT_1199929 [Suillus fuscotomentosus]
MTRTYVDGTRRRSGGTGKFVGMHWAFAHGICCIGNSVVVVGDGVAGVCASASTNDKDGGVNDSEGDTDGGVGIVDGGIGVKAGGGQKSTAGNDETDELRNGEDADVEESESDNGRRRKKMKKAKMKAPQGDDTNPANQEHNNNIKILCTQWVCHKKLGCRSDHCFINPTNNIHFELGFSHFDCWAAAMCKGKEHATEDRPPNHRLFEALFENEYGPTKSLLTECCQQRNTVKNLRDPAAPVIHVNFPVDMLHGLHAGLPPVPPAHHQLQPLALPVHHSLCSFLCMLI